MFIERAGIRRPFHLGHSRLGLLVLGTTKKILLNVKLVTEIGYYGLAGWWTNKHAYLCVSAASDCGGASVLCPNNPEI
jgi:hypothetical protein